MEAVGAAAAIAELSGLSLRVGKAAKNLMLSFVHAPAEIAELNSKIERLHLLIQQIDLLCADLPAGDSDLLFPPQHRALTSLSLQRTLDSLVSLRSSEQTPNQNGVRGRMRWAAIDKRKAQRFIRSIQEAESALDFPLQILTIRLTTINQNSIAAVAVGQALLHETLLESVQGIKLWVSQELSRVQEPATQTDASTKAVSRRGCHDEGLRSSREGKDDPVQRLIEHDMRRTWSYHEATVGNTSRDMTFETSWPILGAAAVLRRNRNSTKIKLLLNIACKLFGATILKGEWQISIKCRSWSLEPQIASSITALNLRPTDSPIFVACRERDLNQVRYLLHTGEASIYDIDEKLGGLLEHVVYGKIHDTMSGEDEESFLCTGQRLLEHLLDQGCDAGLYVGRKMPAILIAFQEGFSAAVSSMLSHGADLSDFGNQPAGLLGNTVNETAAFLWQIGLLRSLGFSDWTTTESTDNLLYGACWHRQMDMVCFALEVAGIDPNLAGGLDRVPIGNAAQEGWVEGVAVLVVAGARVDVSSQSYNGTPLLRSIHDARLNDAGHFLLLQGADPSICDSQGFTAWDRLWYTPRLVFCILGQKGIPFGHFGSSLAHLLHHGADPFEVFNTLDGMDRYGFTRPRRWFNETGYVRFSDVSVIFNQDLGDCEQAKAMMHDLWPWIEEEPLGVSNGAKNFHWDDYGNIYVNRASDDTCAEDSRSDTSEIEYSGDIELSRTEPAGRADDGLPKVAIPDDIDHLGSNEGSGECHEYGEKEDTFRRLAPSMDNVEKQETGSKLNVTRFRHHIGNEQGRRQLSRFPLVRLLCDVLQHSGYRAEMDDDGDIWYDCDDGDRYLDAWEYQDEDHDDATWLPKACPICQNLEAYGLGHILDQAERGRAQYYEYRDKVKQGKMSLYL